jgi:hypothetical protein
MRVVSVPAESGRAAGAADAAGGDTGGGVESLPALSAGILGCAAPLESSTGAAGAAGVMIAWGTANTASTVSVADTSIAIWDGT